MSTLVPIDQVRPSTYNPRVTDPARLELVSLSLRKLGFVLPIYANPDGEILSGHQRHLAAVELGWEAVPVERVNVTDLSARQALNVVFNRATNDFRQSDTVASINQQFDRAAVVAWGEALPDKTGDARFPCLKTQALAVSDLIAANSGKWNDYARNLARTLNRYHILMPVVVRSSLRVVNGIGRVQFLAEENIPSAEVLIVSEPEADFAEAMLNLLSMDFNIQSRYADLLRHNSFRRSRGSRAGKALGMGMTIPLGMARNSDFDCEEPGNVELFRQKYGATILDFGAGRLEDTSLLRSKGIQADAFEPYTLTPGTDEINPEIARSLTLEFLETVRSGKQWSSIFLQAVLNSVPFDTDRRHVVTILAALAGPYTTVYAYAASRKGHLDALKKGMLYQQQSKLITFQLDYEPGIVLGEYSTRPKVQKYFALNEFMALFSRSFMQVQQAYTRGGQCFVEVRRPRALNIQALAEALAFEFDLPYPDGSRLGLAGEARRAFGQRLGVNLTSADVGREV
ncbi:MAG: ParB N-terminal domain-containing protein [Chloroflexi bacterium]|nr:ParB N-terminal domain-containing protein [Chloroflexota bacterium]